MNAAEITAKLTPAQREYLIAFNAGDYPLPDLPGAFEELADLGLLGTDGEGEEWPTELGLEVEALLEGGRHE